jgi:hypothetical protein
MNRIITGIIFFFLFSTLAKAQLSIDYSQLQNFLDRNHLRINEIKGTPYLNSEYETGTILSDAGILYENVPLRYDCFNDILEFKRDSKTYYADPKESVKKAEFGGKVFVYKAFEKEGDTDKSYFEEVVTGKAALYTRYSVNFHEAVPTDGFTDARPAQFGDLMETSYISIDTFPAKKILNNKKLVEILSDKKNEVEAFISKQKLSVKKKDDLKKIVTYYNSLFQ